MVDKVVNVIATVVAFALIGLAVYWISKEVCETKFSSYITRWAWFGGCQILHEGNWVPENNFRVL